jgi:predicted Zn-dependent peptidase
VTVYQDWFPASSLETIFKLEGDRIGHLSIDPKMVDSERGVVLSERSTGLENSNAQMLIQELDSVAFVAHPYAIPTIGWESDIKAWTQKDLENYFRTYYAPNNAVSVIVGDVKVEDVKKLATKYLGSIPKRATPPAVRTVEPEQKGERRLFVAKPSATSANLIVAYKVPERASADTYALDLLQSVLTDGKTSRLYKALVETRLATSVGANSSDGFDPGLLYIMTVAAAGVEPARIEKAMLEAIDKVVKEGVSEEELQKVKNSRLLGIYRQQETINGKAQMLGNYEVFNGDYKKAFDAPAAYEKLTVADIQAVAAKYLKKSQRTIGVLAAKED